MNFVNPSLSILFVAIVYLSLVYGLLAIARLDKRGNNDVAQNSQETSN